MNGVVVPSIFFNPCKIHASYKLHVICVIHVIPAPNLPANRKAFAIRIGRWLVGVHVGMA